MGWVDGEALPQGSEVITEGDGASGKEPPASAGDTKDSNLIPGSGRSLEEGMATHSSILAWRIPWTETPGGLQCMGLQSVGHG